MLPLSLSKKRGNTGIMPPLALRQVMPPSEERMMFPTEGASPGNNVAMLGSAVWLAAHTVEVPLLRTTRKLARLFELRIWL